MESRRHLLPLALALLGFFSRCVTPLTSRVSFSLGSPGRQLTRFGSPDVGNTTTLLLSDDGDTLYVGGRDAVIALDVRLEDTMVLRNKLDWSPSEKDLDQCSMKGKKMANCPNFIRVLKFLNATHIYACGTFAFSPRCIYINSETLTVSLKFDEGRGRCPYDPYQRNTAIIVDGELYTGTVADYRGNWPLISRHLSEGTRLDLKLDDSLGWLEDPTFISSTFIPDEGKIYFFFSEVGREYDFIDKFIVSRVSQICTSDIGGQRTLQRRWTTFAKAQLLCQADNELPYNVIQDIDSLPPADGAPTDDTLFYGIFTSQWSVNSGLSAVCSFRLSDIRSAFSGNYKVLNRDTLQWSTRVQEKVANPGECGLHNASDNALRFVKENFLADDSVRPAGRSLTLVSAVHIYSHLSVQRVRAANSVDYTVLFLLTESGYLHKAVLLQSGAHIVEEVQVFEKAQPVKSLKLSVPKGVVYVGTSEGVIRLPTANCSFYWTCAQCVLARDPFCGWDPSLRACVMVSGAHVNLGQDIERGNVVQACKSVALTPRARFGPNNMPAASCPTGELVSVSLNEVVRLQCPAASRLSRQSWERPNSRLSSDLYLHLEDGSLSFVATPATLGHYLCLSTENGFQQTMAIYHVKQKSSHLPQTPTKRGWPQTLPSPTEWEARTRRTESKQAEPTLMSGHTHVTAGQLGSNFTLWMVKTAPKEAAFRDGEPLMSGSAPCYLKELVVVSILLVLCLSLLVSVMLYSAKQRWRSRTVPHAPGTPGQDPDRSSPVEHEVLRGSPSQRKCNGHMQHGGAASGMLCNGALTGSNGHLPNTPI
ncbi:semaphorin-4A isoform X1 [Nerophis ophidion]|uniref:semaphorin-4A isoform X1 n=1 Tax=Nerophis ophidion TaxID=159077 RepID=UPI002AE07319|nr:semaphorin-4A isoform X1 [Nerophis ophidion]XP_061753394.1 semaphorin-4A isoform X1 [Nerophis ophidion]XP_061753395.1 semaphorin-4A isoform X1 [Nerophis ophidion]XP_061753396.1 semaphorin-4A isoform X1 [Nerophis ophidion]XP_061753397.1 semaphorin-4A isoform X1 [Nerophis ophidion]XP_061753398.1 semaphorin-4A isoform X1 [Nerophis ophidion]